MGEAIDGVSPPAGVQVRRGRSDGGDGVIDVLQIGGPVAQQQIDHRSQRGQQRGDHRGEGRLTLGEPTQQLPRSNADHDGGCQQTEQQRH